MTELERFWIPMAQVLPVFILGLVVEARVAFAPATMGKQAGRGGAVSATLENLDGKNTTGRQKRLIAVLTVGDRVLTSAQTVIYVFIFVLAMALVVSAFILCVAAMAQGDAAGLSSADAVVTAAIIGAVLTGLLPIGRLLTSVFGREVVDPAASWFRKKVSKERKGSSARD